MRIDGENHGPWVANSHHHVHSTMQPGKERKTREYHAAREGKEDQRVPARKEKDVGLLHMEVKLA